jgi:predicted DNA-binding transcriptional regulator YafY
METIQDNVRYVTGEELAARMHVSVRTLQRLVDRGLVPKPIRFGRRVLYPIKSSGWLPR